MEGETCQKCSKYHTKWHVLVPTCCKYKASDFPRNPPKNTPYSQKRFEKLWGFPGRDGPRDGSFQESGLEDQRRGRFCSPLTARPEKLRRTAAAGGSCKLTLCWIRWCFSINGDTQNGWFIPTDPAGAGRKMLTWLGFLLMGSMAHHI